MSDAQPLLLIYLDTYHLGDPLFLSAFARDVKMHIGPAILMHGSGEEAERALEARGLLNKEERSRPVAQQLVERAMRELNRRIVHEMNEAGVSAVGVLGSDRGLLRKAEEGAVAVGRIEWLVDLTLQGVFPVVGGLVGVLEGDCIEGGTSDVLVALEAALRESGRLEPAIVAFTTDRKAGLFDGSTHIPTIGVNGVTSHSSIADVEVLCDAAASVRIRLTTPTALRHEGLPKGTDLV